MDSTTGKVTALTPQRGIESNIAKLKSVLAADSVRSQFEDVLKENAGAFVASIIDLYGNDKRLQGCDPNAVVFEALKAASLKLAINRTLGHAWIIAYKGIPSMQLGYKGWIQMALRTGQYRYINTDVVCDGQFVSQDFLTGEPDLSGEIKDKNKIVGYFAHIGLLNGYRKTIYLTKEKVLDHAEKYSPSFSRSDSPWKTEPDKMSMKVVLAMLLGRYGVVSVEMAKAFEYERSSNLGVEPTSIADANTIPVNTVLRAPFYLARVNGDSPTKTTNQRIPAKHKAALDTQIEQPPEDKSPSLSLGVQGVLANELFDDENQSDF